MSLNTAHANGGVLIFSGECILLYCDGVEISFDGSKEPIMKGSKKGRLYLTTHRMIFTSKDGKDLMQSFSFPFFSMRQIELEQPVFGANYIRAIVRAQPDGNWMGEAKFKIHFMNGGAIEYGQAMLKAAKMASRNMPSEPPAYMPPSGPYHAAAPGSYAAPQGYGWVPPGAPFANAPPANSVYMTQEPPPYPGIYAAPPGYPPAYNGYNGAAGGMAPPKPMTAAELKAMEAEQSAYMDPNNPNTAYIPPPAYYQPPPGYDQAPPPYSEASKKDN